MTIRKPTGKDNRITMDHDSFRKDDVTEEWHRSVVDEVTHAKLDALINSNCPYDVMLYDNTSVGATEVELKVGATVLANRRIIVILNTSNFTLYYGTTGVTTTGEAKGYPILKGQTIAITASENLALFIIAGAADRDFLIQEWACL